MEKCADYIVYLHQGKITLQGAKDDLLGSYGRLVCTRADLEYVDPKLLHGTRVSQFSCEALVRDRHAFSVRYPRLTVDPVTLEEMGIRLDDAGFAKLQEELVQHSHVSEENAPRVRDAVAFVRAQR